MDEAFLKLHADIHARLEAGTPEDVREAGRLCALLPPATAETQEHIDHLQLSVAFALETLGETEWAASLYRGLMERHGSCAEPRSNACLRYGLIREMQNGSEESEAAYRLALSLATLPEIAHAARERLAALALRDGRLAEAQGHLDALIADPAASGARLLAYKLRRLQAQVRAGVFDPNERDWSTLLSSAAIDDSIVGPLAEAAADLEGARHPELARDFYLRLLEVSGISDHTRVNCNYRLGEVYDALADWDKSLLHYRAAADTPLVFPEAQVHARFRLASLLYLSEEYEAAVEPLALLRFAPEITPQQRLEAHYRLGVSLLRLGRFEEARRELEDCGRRDADGEYCVKCDLSLAELFEQRKDFRAARERYQRVMASPSAEPLTKAAALTRMHPLR